MSLNEVILAIPPGTKLGLKIKEDNELGGVVITTVRETCTFKDIVEIGWRITSIDNIPVTSKDDFNAKDPNKLRVMKFAKLQIARQGSAAKKNDLPSVGYTPLRTTTIPPGHDNVRGGGSVVATPGPTTSGRFD
jgi:hypothetical protein